MKNYTHHFELQDILKMFSNAFNDIIIKRYNKDRAPEDQIHVNFKYAPKTRVLYDLVQKEGGIKLPCIAISIGGIKRNQNRVFNKIDGAYFSNFPTQDSYKHLLQPVPIDLTVNMSIITNFQSDMDQILTNFIPYSDPYVVISWKWPDIIPWSDFEIRSHVLWSENVNLQYPIDIANNAPYRIIADTSFTIETWMFKNNPGFEAPIYTIDMSFAAMSAITTYEDMLSQENENNTDYIMISARPQFYLAWPYVTYTGDTRKITCQGRMFDYIDNLYLSGSDINMFPFVSGTAYYYDSADTLVPYVTTNPKWVDTFETRTMEISSVSGNITMPMSTYYPSFSGYEVDFTVLDEHLGIEFNVELLNSGTFDIIAVNGAGYGKLTLDSIRPINNPYPINSFEYDSYEEFQFPTISGIEVRQI
jgi:hypothetical protein